MKTTIAIYFDLENVSKDLNIDKLLQSITLKIEDSKSPIFAIKLACGETESIAKFREQLKDLNFEIRETPHVSQANLKNRADLILSIEAFESLYQQSPEIDLYVFITSDTDFTVVMDKLRKYGKEVWLVTRKQDKEKKLFTSSTDEILVIEDNFTEDTTKQEEKIDLILQGLGFSKTESERIRKTFESYEKDKWHKGSGFGTKIKNMIKDFSYKEKKVNSQNKLFAELEKHKYLETKKEGSTDSFKIIK